jgi:hypothetical protein
LVPEAIKAREKSMVAGYYAGDEKEKGLRNSSKPLIYLVAGAGFEPATFGL